MSLIRIYNLHNNKIINDLFVRITKCLRKQMFKYFKIYNCQIRSQIHHLYLCCELRVFRFHDLSIK